MKATEIPFKTDKISRSIRHLKDFTCTLFIYKKIWSNSKRKERREGEIKTKASEWLSLVRFGYPALTQLCLSNADQRILETTWKMGLEFLLPKYSTTQILLLQGAYRVFANSIWEHFQRSRTHCSLNWHLPVHFTRLMNQWGPLINQWCWVVERMNQKCKAIIDSGNHKDVENWLMREVNFPIQRKKSPFQEKSYLDHH